MKLKKLNFFKNVYYLEIIFPALIFSFFRQPLYFSKPRIWAEDGTIYLNNEIIPGVIESLLDLDKHNLKKSFHIFDS